MAWLRHHMKFGNEGVVMGVWHHGGGTCGVERVKSSELVSAKEPKYVEAVIDGDNNHALVTFGNHVVCRRRDPASTLITATCRKKKDECLKLRA